MSAAPDNPDESDKMPPEETDDSKASGQQPGDTIEKAPVQGKRLVVKKDKKRVTVKWLMPMKYKGIQIRKKEVKRIIVKWKIGKKTKTKTLTAGKKSYKFKCSKKQKG